MGRRVEDNPADQTAKDMAVMMFNTATLRSGFSLKDTVNFAENIEAMMRKTLGVDVDEEIEAEEELQMRSLQRMMMTMRKRRRMKKRKRLKRMLQLMKLPKTIYRSLENKV